MHVHILNVKLLLRAFLSCCSYASNTLRKGFSRLVCLHYDSGSCDGLTVLLVIEQSGVSDDAGTRDRICTAKGEPVQACCSSDIRLCHLFRPLVDCPLSDVAISSIILQQGSNDCSEYCITSGYPGWHHCCLWSFRCRK